MDNDGETMQREQAGPSWQHYSRCRNAIPHSSVLCSPSRSLLLCRTSLPAPRILASLFSSPPLSTIKRNEEAKVLSKQKKRQGTRAVALHHRQPPHLVCWCIDGREDKIGCQGAEPRHRTPNRTNEQRRQQPAQPWLARAVLPAPLCGSNSTDSDPALPPFCVDLT